MGDWRVHTSIWRSVLVSTTLVWVLTFPLAAVAETEQDRARAMAERFATGRGSGTLPARARRVVPAAQPEPAEEQRLNEEIDMLARARAEAEARREELVRAREAADNAEQAATAKSSANNAAEQRRTADERQKAEEALRAAEATRAKAEEARHAAEMTRKAEDERRIAEQRRQEEQAQRLADERRRSDEARIASESRAKAKAERMAAEQRLADEALAKVEEAKQTAMEAEREAEADRIAETLRKARQARMSRGVMDTRATTSGGRDVIEDRPTPRDRDESREDRLPHGSRSGDIAMDSRRPDERPGTFGQSGHDDASGSRNRHPEWQRYSTRVTVLLILEPGNYGIRRNNRTADPLLCAEQGCYVSAGAGLSAELLRKRRALGVGRTLGERAGACRNSLGCVFRDVDLGAYPAFVQPVDMHVIKHDRRQPQMLHETSDCRLVAERLACSAIRGPDYTMWVVPQDLAEHAGPAALERALEDGLPDAGALSYAPSRQR